MPRGGKRTGAGAPKRFGALKKKQYHLEEWMIQRIKDEADRSDPKRSESDILRDILTKALQQES